MILGAYLKRARERGDRVTVWWGKRGKARGFLAKRPSPSSPHGSEQREEGDRAAAGLEGGGAGGPGHGGGRGMGQREEGDEGISSPCSPWARMRCGGGSA
jgi:LmbE family N-acetylglucosaminyl deacetylase